MYRCSGQETTFQTPMVNSTSYMYSHLVDFLSLFVQPPWPTRNHMFRTSKCHAITRFSPDVRIVWRNFGVSFVHAKYPVLEGVSLSAGWEELEKHRFV